MTLDDLSYKFGSCFEKDTDFLLIKEGARLFKEVYPEHEVLIKEYVTNLITYAVVG